MCSDSSHYHPVMGVRMFVCFLRAWLSFLNSSVCSQQVDSVC